jgi:hypothetical protein
MLKLLSITLSRSSTLLSGDGYSILPEVLERLLPLLARTDLAQLHREATDVICKILALLHTTAPGLLAALVQGTHTLFEGGAPLQGRRCVRGWRGGSRLAAVLLSWHGRSQVCLLLIQVPLLPLRRRV